MRQPPSSFPADEATPSPRRPWRQTTVILGMVAAGLASVLMACGGGSASSSTDTASGGTGSSDSTSGTSGGTGGGTGTGTTPVTPDTSTPVVPTTPPKATVLTNRLSNPWGLGFLPDGRMLITQKAGTLVLVSADGKTVSSSITGLPQAWVDTQGGLLDIAVDPEFDLTSNPWIYWSYAEGDATSSGTVVARGKLQLNAGAPVTGASAGSVTQVQELFRQQPRMASSGHYGSRLAFRSDKTLFITLGERQQDYPESPGLNNAQNPAVTLGKVVRIHRDGSIPTDNPFVGSTSARPEVWSLGHRNPQGAAVHPVTGDLWLTEHGPQGGDELNHVVPKGNYGWPLRSYGCPYTFTGTPGPTCRIGGGTHAPDFIEPVSYWEPKSIAISGLLFYTGSQFPEWKHNAFVGGMKTYADFGLRRGLWRLVLNGDTVVSRERLPIASDPATGKDPTDDRVRDVRQGPDGWIYLITDSGTLVRIER